VVANAQPFWSCLDGAMRELTLPFLDPERAGWQYPWASLRRAGAVLAFGSDWSVSTANPLEEIEVAVRRAAPDDRDGEPFLPAERVDLPTALMGAPSGRLWGRLGVCWSPVGEHSSALDAVKSFVKTVPLPAVGED
jgi:predicted amidohydrolase YtcJ